MVFYVTTFLIAISFRPKKGLYLEKHFCADGLPTPSLTRGDTPSSFAPGYQDFAHTGLNTQLCSITFLSFNYKFKSSN